MQEQLRVLADIKDKAGDITMASILRNAADEIDNLKLTIKTYKDNRRKRLEALQILID